MAISEAQQRRLEEILELSTVYLEGVKDSGTGFYISESLILTAAHLVGEVGSPVAIFPIRGEKRTGSVLSSSPLPEGHDVALVEDRDGGSTHAVLLTTEYPGAGDAFALGFPPAREPISSAGQPKPESGEALDDAPSRTFETIHYSIHKRGDLATGGLHKIVLGDNTVGRGMSGGPLVSVANGRVVGLVQYKLKDEDGGGAVPMSTIAEVIRQVETLSARWPEQSKAWSSVLGLDPRGEVASSPGRILTISVSGGLDEWHFAQQIDKEPETEPRTFRLDQIGPMGEVIFGWLRRRQAWDEEDYALAARVLREALLPDGIEGLDGIALRFGEHSQLGDIPWELASATRDAAADSRGSLATQNGFEFTRVVGELGTSASEPPETAKVLCLGPPEVIDHFRGDLDLPGPDSEDMFADLKCFTAKFEAPSQEVRLVQLLGDEKPQIVHYVGYGRSGKAGPELQLAKSRKTGNRLWISLDQLRHQASGTPRLLVIQTLAGPPEERWVLEHASEVASAIEDPVAAIVYTQYPVHKDAAMNFNIALYRHLSEGKPIEAAVQDARMDLSSTRANAWAPGSFALVTNGRRGFRAVRAKGKEDETKPASGEVERTEPGGPESAAGERENDGFEFSG